MQIAPAMGRRAMLSGRFDQLAGTELTAGSAALTAHAGFWPTSDRPHGNCEVAK
jgi:hypothetical protein